MEKWILTGVTLVMLLICTISDVKSRKIPVCVITAGAVGTVFCTLIQPEMTLGKMLSGMMPGIIMLIISIVTDEQIGIGDSLIFCVLGIGHGFVAGIAVLGISLGMTAVTAVVLLCLKKVGKRDQIAFVPFILTGYCLVLAGGMCG